VNAGGHSDFAAMRAVIPLCSPMTSTRGEFSVLGDEAFYAGENDVIFQDGLD